MGNEAGRNSVDGTNTKRRRYAESSQHRIVWLTKNSTFRSRRRRNSGGLEGTVKDFQLGYVSTFHNWQISHFRPSITVRTLKKSGRRTRVGERMVYSGWMRKFSFACDQNATNTHAAGNRKTCRPLKKILNLNSTGTTARRPRSTTKSS